MNRTYKVIWSKARRCYVVVSELAKGQHKSSSKSEHISSNVHRGYLGKASLAAVVASLLTVGGLVYSPVMAADKDIVEKGAQPIAYDINPANDGTNIAVGKNAKVFIGGGTQESMLSFGEKAELTMWHDLIPTGWNIHSNPNAKRNLPEAIAVGTNSYARTGSIEIGAHTLVENKIAIGDTTADQLQQFGVASTTLGTNSYTGGGFATTIGSYNVQTNPYDAKNVTSGATKNAFATVIGTFNSNESLSSDDSTSGVANMISGAANKVTNSNGAIVMGAGNSVKNSIDSFDTSSYSRLFKSAADMQKTLMDGVAKSAGGATLVIGGGNTAENTLKTQIIGVNNKVTGTKGTPADFNLVDGYKNTATHVKHATVIGSGNTVSGEEKDNVEGLILLGDNRNVWKQADHSVVIGSSDDTEHSYVTRPDTVVIGHNAYIEDHGGNTSGGGDIAIGHNSFVENYVNQSGSIAFGENTHVRNSVGSTENAFVLGQYKTTQDPAGTTIPTDVAKMNASIAIGENTFARTGSLMVGTHKYTGEIGDTTVDTSDATSMAQANQQINETVLGTNSFSLGAFSTVTGAYSIISGDYDKGKWRNFGSSITGSLNSIESKTATTADAGNASHIIGTANRMQNANGAVVIGSGNEITDSYAAMRMPTSNNTSAKDLSEKIRESIKAHGGGAAAIVGNGNEVKKSTNVAVMGSKNSVTSTTNSQIFGDNRAVTGADGAPIDGAVIIGSAAAKSPLTTDKKNVTILGYNANATAEGGVALGAGSIADTEAGAFGWDPKTNDKSTIDSKVWKSSWAAVSVGDGTHTRQITNVAAGLNETDAVNVAQLKAAMENAAPKIDFVAGDGIQIEKDSTGTKYTIKANITGGTTTTDTTTVAPKADGNSSGKEEGNSSSTGASDTSGSGKALEVKTETKPINFAADEGTAAAVKPSGTLGILGDKTNISTKVDGANITVSLKKDITVDSVKAGNTTVNNEGVTIAGGPSMTVNGIDAGGKKITNVASGTEASDAVNYGQLRDVENKVDQNTQGIYHMNNRISDLDNRVNKVGAGAAALAALHPLDFDPDDKWDFAVGYGNYRNANSVAFGAFYRPNEDTMFSLGTNFGNGENMFNAGLSFKIGQGSGITTSKTAMAKKIESLEDTVDKQDKKIAELEALVKEQGEMIRQYVGKK